MATRSEMIAALKAKLAALPVLSEGQSYTIEMASQEKLVKGTLRHIVDDAPLGRGFSFQLKDRRLFVYERDLRPGPNGVLLVTGTA